MGIDFASLESEFGVARYQVEAIQKLLEYTSLTGRRVLEVGGSNLPQRLTHGVLGAAEWVSVDIIGQGAYQLSQQSEHYSSIGIRPLRDAATAVGRADYVILDGPIEEALDLPLGYFDVVVSITSFEHILAIPAALAAIRRAKRVGAPFFSYHGPIWSGPYGHHVWVDSLLNFNNDEWIEPHGHLLHSPPEMYARVVSRVGHERAQRVVLQMYNEPRINRFFYEDYEAFFRGALVDLEISSYFDRPLPDGRQLRLEALYPRYRRFSAYGMTVFGR
ncbi:MAG: hypothetical protein JNL14_16055 [Devosia sp.]|uniref:hypothetical protein n=1 Tax=Devosia sp. TaxID=1871048 RepID=UPI001A3EA6FB|nr:hypothetical protein [Devosia sp.]MBL8599247.1 hypothetical protein [Devosia sp.]